MDIRKPYFGTSVELTASDFQAAPSKGWVGTISGIPAGGWYSATLNSTAYQFINLKGTTQFRLRFKLDDNDDMNADFMKFYSGDADLTNHPVLVIEYYVP